MPNLVPAVGPTDARIALVGEAPGQTEARTGEPFTGTSGRLLDYLLSQARLARNELYITNVVKEHPPRNNIAKFISKRGKKIVTTPAFDVYVERLRDELSLLDPNVIIAAGNVSLYALAGKWGIQSWRGSILESTLIPGKKVIPIIHPAAALRQYIQRWFILFDLKRIKQHENNPTVTSDKTQYLLHPTYDDTIGYLDLLRDKDLIAFDIETSHGQLDCISFAYRNDEAISIPFYEGNNEYWNIAQEREIILRVAKLLESDQRKLAHNTMFDARFLLERYGIKGRCFEDTLIAHKILFPDFPARLEFVTSTYTDISYYKDEGKEAIYNKAGSNKTFWLYNAKDSVALIQAWPKIVRDLHKQGNWSTYEAQRNLIEPLLYISYRGIRMDRPGLKAASVKAETRIAQLRGEINEIVGREINAGSPTQLKDLFYSQLRLKPIRKRNAKGEMALTTDEKALIKIKTLGHPIASPVAERLLEDRKLSKRNGTYYKVKLSPDGRLRCTMNPVGTKTGRLSSSKSKIDQLGANLQNQPWDMKRLMLTDEGCVVYEIDLAQAENRVVAYVSREQNMIHAFEQGRDIHRQTASLIFRCGYADISDEKNTAGISDWSQRDVGKKANHALNYGMREAKAAHTWEVGFSTAKPICEGYHAAYPGVRRWHAEIEAQLRRNRTLENLFGRRYTFWDRLDSNDTLLAAYAFPAQSTVADVINRWGVIPFYADQDTFGNAELMIQIHDSITIQIPLSVGWDEHARILLALKASLERTLTAHDVDFIIPADIKMKPHNYLDGWEIAEKNDFGGKTFPTAYLDQSTFARALRDNYQRLTETAYVS